jgi:uracil-DNA glycosylase
MERIQPNTLLLGEAPGYKGCRITGVPFTSERVLTEVSFFKDQGYQCLHQPDQLESEISATIVWKELARYSDKPLIWNIFPFHPHASNDQRSNRPPNKQELEIGTHFLIALLAIFPVEKIIALGRKAESQIKKLGYEYAYVRHPARGGKNKFMAGLRTAY